MSAEVLVIAGPDGGGSHSTTSEVCHVAADVARHYGWRCALLTVSGDPPYKGNPDAVAEAVASASRHARLVLMGATASGKDIMARVAGILQVPLLQDCIRYRLTADSVVFTRPLYGGKLLSEVRVSASPVLATFRPRTQPAAKEAASLLVHAVKAGRSYMEASLSGAASSRALDVSEADIVISGGRGMGGPEHWPILEDLVAVLGSRATLACSRPVSDAGWRPRSEHVGQTGRVIAPAVYVACGISGAIQHVAGIRGSGLIIAINRDAQAPIFQVSDYGIVGDVFTVVPALTRAIAALQEGP